MQINCKNIKVGYGSKVVVKDLNFQVQAGDYILVIGENGAGKSTLIKTLLGLIPVLDGELEFIIPKNQIGYLPQQTDIQKDFPATVEEVVLSGCINKMGLRPFYNKAEKVKAGEAIEKLGITDLKSESFRELSGGQKQRVLLARALCASSKILILDEPVSGLDPKTTKELYDLIKILNKEISIIMISHDVKTSLDYASHILKIGSEPSFITKEKYKEEEVTRNV